jgi:hypothetical protein
LISLIITVSNTKFTDILISFSSTRQPIIVI